MVTRQLSGLLATVLWTQVKLVFHSLCSSWTLNSRNLGLFPGIPEGALRTDSSPLSLGLHKITKGNYAFASGHLSPLCLARTPWKSAIYNVSSSLFILGTLTYASLSQVLSFLLGGFVEWHLGDSLLPGLSVSRLGASFDVAITLSIELFDCFCLISESTLSCLHLSEAVRSRSERDCLVRV